MCAQGDTTSWAYVRTKLRPTRTPYSFPSPVDVLRAVSDGFRVLRTLMTEWRRARSGRRMERRLSEPAVANPATVGDRLAA